MNRPLRRTPILLGLFGLLGLLLLPIPHQPAQADERAAPSGYWVYDVRVVQVQADPLKGLEPAPWEGGESTVASTWKEHLTALEARGKLFVMLDQRTAGTAGAFAEVETLTTIPLKRFDNETVQGTTFRFDRIQTGVKAAFLTVEALDYQIAVDWLHYPVRDGAVPTGKTMWQGSHAPIAEGRTLALVSRQHILGRTGEPEIAELHCFITARFTGK